MASNRIHKVNQLFQQELGEAIRKKNTIDFKGVIISITQVRTTQDLSLARVYVSIFPVENQKSIFESIKEDIPYYRNHVAKTVANKMRKIPELVFYLDTSIEKTEAIDRSLRGEGENPIL